MRVSKKNRIVIEGEMIQLKRGRAKRSLIYSAIHKDSFASTSLTMTKNDFFRLPQALK